MSKFIQKAQLVNHGHKAGLLCRSLGKHLRFYHGSISNEQCSSRLNCVQISSLQLHQTTAYRYDINPLMQKVAKMVTWNNGVRRHTGLTHGDLALRPDCQIAMTSKLKTMG